MTYILNKLTEKSKTTLTTTQLYIVAHSAWAYVRMHTDRRIPCQQNAPTLPFLLLFLPFGSYTPTNTTTVITHSRRLTLNCAIHKDHSAEHWHDKYPNQPELYSIKKWDIREYFTIVMILHVYCMSSNVFNSSPYLRSLMNFWMSWYMNILCWCAELAVIDNLSLKLCNYPRHSAT